MQFLIRLRPLGSSEVFWGPIVRNTAPSNVRQMLVQKLNLTAEGPIVVTRLDARQLRNSTKPLLLQVAGLCQPRAGTDLRDGG